MSVDLKRFLHGLRPSAGQVALSSWLSLALMGCARDQGGASAPPVLSARAARLGAGIANGARLSQDQRQRLEAVLRDYDQEVKQADKDLHDRWFARTVEPAPQEVHDAREGTVRLSHSLADKYFEMIDQLPLQRWQRDAVDAGRIAARIATEWKIDEQQQAQVNAAAVQMIAEVPEAPTHEACVKLRLAGLGERVQNEILTPEQRRMLTESPPQPDWPLVVPRSLLPSTGPGSMKYHNIGSAASNPGRFRLLMPPLLAIEPALSPPAHKLAPDTARAQFVEELAEQLHYGDTRAAIVMSIDPLLIAAYTDELDCVVILSYPRWLVAKHRLEVGSRLLTVNTYPWHPLATDLVRGPRDKGRYVNVFPIIAEFVTDDRERVRLCTAAIDEQEWQRCLRLGQEYRVAFPQRIRDGSPLRSVEPR